MCRALQRCLIGTALSLSATIAAADAITITFEQTLDLDTGTIGDLDILPDESTGALRQKSASRRLARDYSRSFVSGKPWNNGTAARPKRSLIARSRVASQA